MAHSQQNDIFGRIPPEVALLILAHLDDRSFWMARRAHRVFRLEHTASDAQRRVAYWWLRTSPERAIERGRSDVLLFLRERKRIPLNFSPWSALVRHGRARALETALAAFPADYDQSIVNRAIANGHTDLVLRMHSQRELSITDSISAALRAERSGMALALCRAAAVKDWPAWARVAAQCGHVAFIQLFLGRCHTQQRPTPTDLASEAVYAEHDRAARRTLGFLIDRFPNTIEWGRVFDVAIEQARSYVCVMARAHASPSLDLQSRLDQAFVYARGDCVRILLQLDPTLCLQRALDRIADKVERSRLDGPSTVVLQGLDALCALVEADTARALDPRRAFEAFYATGMLGRAAYLTGHYTRYYPCE